MSEHLLELHPKWREAEKDFLDGGFGPGDTVSYDWLYEKFGIERPTGTTLLEQAQRAELLFLGNFKSLEGALLKDHQIALKNVRGVGYMVVAPGDQTKWADHEGMTDIKKGIRKMAGRIANVDLTALDSDQRRENADYLAKVAALRAMVRESKKITQGGVAGIDSDPS